MMWVEEHLQCVVLGNSMFCLLIASMCFAKLNLLNSMLSDRPVNRTQGSILL